MDDAFFFFPEAGPNFPLTHKSRRFPPDLESQVFPALQANTTLSKTLCSLSWCVLKSLINPFHLPLMHPKNSLSVTEVSKPISCLIDQVTQRSPALPSGLPRTLPSDRRSRHHGQGRQPRPSRDIGTRKPEPRLTGCNPSKRHRERLQERSSHVGREGTSGHRGGEGPPIPTTSPQPVGCQKC